MESSKTLIRLMLKKEKVHWTRTKSVYKVMDDFGSKFISFPILVILISFFHYCFAFMHFLFEVYMFIFNRRQFFKNMISSHKKVDNKLLQMKPQSVTA